MIDFVTKSEHVPSYKLVELPNGKFVIERHWEVVLPSRTNPYESREAAQADYDALVKS